MYTLYIIKTLSPTHLHTKKKYSKKSQKLKEIGISEPCK